MCDICSGSRFINLPIRRPISLAQCDEVLPTMEQSSRRYPCPECSAETAETHRVLNIGAAVNIDPRHLEENKHDYTEYVKIQIARLIAHEMLKGGCITFKTRPSKDRWEPTEMIGTVGVVSATASVTIDERAKQAALPMIEAIGDIATRKINVWGSHFGRETITKDDAIRFINEAIREAAKP